MKKSLFLLLTGMLVVCLCTPLQAEGTILSGISMLDAYEEMLSLFEMKDYGAAQSMLEQHDLSEKNFRDSRLYAGYISAMACMDAEEYGQAAALLEGLMNNDPPFQDSKLLYHYCTGRYAQQQGDYALAIDSYNQAISYGDAADRLLECTAARDQAQIAAAKACYDSAVLVQDAEKMKQAAQMYEDLGDVNTATQIRSEILVVEKKREYADAVARYEQAAEKADAAALTELGLYFAALGDYENSAALAQDCADRLASLSRTLTLAQPQAEQTTLTLSWSDSAPTADGYIVSYAPQGAAEGLTVTTQEQQFTLNDLLPGTVYSVTVAPAKAQERAVSLTAETLPAAAYQGAGFSVQSSRLIGVKTSYLNYYTLPQLLDEKQNVLTYYDDASLFLPAADLPMQPMKYCYIFSYLQAEATGTPVELCWVLRTDQYGAYAQKQTLESGMPAAGRLFADLEPLLSPAYRAAGSWSLGTAVLELYIDGSLAAQGSIALHQSQTNGN